MKVISPSEMIQLETQSLAAGAARDASPEQYMEQAALSIARYVRDYLHLHHRESQVLLLCGKGNNGGDAFTAGRILLEWGIEVSALYVTPLEQCGRLCKKKAQEFTDKGGLLYLFQDSPPPIFSSHGVIVDGLFGTGFTGALEGHYLDLVQWANQNASPILAIDIPSGLNGADGTVRSKAIMATETLFLGLPKTGFFVEQGWDHVGKLRKMEFGLPGELFKNLKSFFKILNLFHLSQLLPPIKRTRHKYEAGYVLLVAGSSAMPGAAILAAHAAMRAGAGVVRLVHPKGMEMQLAQLAPEILRYAYDDTEIVPWDCLLQRVSSVVIGPGIGRTQSLVKQLDILCSVWKGPIVLDADALFFLAQEELRCPPGALLTPHLGELARLLKLPSLKSVSIDLLKQVASYSSKHGCTVIVKGAPTYVVEKEDSIILSLNGDPGMATAGSGDVLSGILGALLAQGMHTPQAAHLGTFLHGFAGECAARKHTSYCLSARDLIELLPLAFQRLLQERSGGLNPFPIRSIRP